MKLQSIAFLLAAGVALPAFAAPENYTIDPLHTYPSYEIAHLGFSTSRGTFESSSGKIVIDREAKTGSVDISIDTASLHTGLQKRDDHLKSSDFFNVAQFPTMTFKSDKLQFKGDKLVGIDGTLTLLGIGKPAKLIISNSKFAEHPMAKKPWAGADATAIIKRSDYGMTTFLPAIGDEVKINIQIEAVKE